MIRTVSKLPLEMLEARQDAPQPHDRVTSIPGSAAVGRTASRLDGNPLEAFVRDSDIKAGGLGDNGRIRTPRFDEHIRAEARMLLVGNCRDDEPASIQTAAFSNAT